MEKKIIFVHHLFDQKEEDDFFSKFQSIFQLVGWDRRYGHRYYHLSIVMPIPYVLQKRRNEYLLKNEKNEMTIARFREDWKGFIHIQSDLWEMRQLVSMYELHHQHLLCPIRQEIMKDPVLLIGDGRSYEREAILNWFQHRKTSPLTNESLTEEECRLITNRTLKDMIHYMIDFSD